VTTKLMAPVPAVAAPAETNVSGQRSRLGRQILALSVSSMRGLIMALPIGSRDRRDIQGDPMASRESRKSGSVDPGLNLQSPWQRAELAFAAWYPEITWALPENAAAARHPRAKVMLGLRRTTKAAGLLFPIRRSPTPVDQPQGTGTTNSSTANADAGGP
jgi:hypothetical protein